MCNEKLRSGSSTSRYAAGGQTTGPDKREFVSHVRTRSLDRSSPRVTARNNPRSPVNDRVSNVMKNRQDRSQARTRKKSPTKLSETPIYSPETGNALVNAEKLLKEAQKKILEASYDVESSPERDLSNGSNGNKRGGDDDSLYIRDLVATRFHEANESGRIFTRATARYPVERFRRPEVCQRRRRYFGERSEKICDEESTIRRLLEMESQKSKNPRVEPPEKYRNSLFSDETKHVKEMPSKKIQESSILKNEEKRHSPCKPGDRSSVNAFRVQEGPRVDIRNELTITRVENVDISPCPRSSLPVKRNIKTFEFRHVSQIDEEKDLVVSEGSEDEVEVVEISRQPEEKKYVSDTTLVPSERLASDLDENKSGHSAQPERLEGHPDTRISNGDEHATNDEKRNNRGESFMDFLRRAGSAKDDFTKEHFPGNDFFDAIEPRDKINIFDRAVEQFLADYQFPENERQDYICQSERNNGDRKMVVDGIVVDNLENSQEECFEDVECCQENWEEINLNPPNLDELENVLRKIGGEMNKMIRETRNLGSLLSEYTNEEDVGNQTKKDSQRECKDSRQSDRDKFYNVPTRDNSSEQELDNVKTKVRKKPTRRIEDEKNRRIDESTRKEKISSRDRIFDEISKVSSRENSKKNSTFEKLTERKDGTHPRFSTPLNNFVKIGGSCGDNADCNCKEFASFLNGIHRSKINSESSGDSSAKIPKVVGSDDDKSWDEVVSVLPDIENNLRQETKIVLTDVERKCDSAELHNRDRLIPIGIDETREIVASQTSSTLEKHEYVEAPNSSTRSLIQDSAIGRETDECEKISFGTNLIDERIMKHDSSKSEQTAAPKNPGISVKQSLRSENTEITTAKTLVLIQNSSEHVSVRKTEIGDKSSSVVQAETLIPAKLTLIKNPTRDNSSKGEEAGDKNHSTKEEGTQETKTKNIASNSPGSSLKDRTSFDVSTDYSDDFEEPTGSTKKSEPDEKINSQKDVISILISNEVEEPLKDSAGNNESAENKETLVPSSQSTKKTVEEIAYLEKSISISETKKEDSKKSNENNSGANEPVREENGSIENDLKKEQTNLDVVFENLNEDRNSNVSSSPLVEVSRTSSTVVQSQNDKLKTPDTCSENYSEGELFLPSSCSYSLGEIRISELGTCGTSGPCVESSSRNVDSVKIFFAKNFANLDLSENTVNGLNSPVQSLGEVQETDVESTTSSRGITLDDENQDKLY